MRRAAPSVWLALALASLVGVLATREGARAQVPSDAVHFRQIHLRSPDGSAARVLVTFARRADGREHPPHERLPILMRCTDRARRAAARTAGSSAGSTTTTCPTRSRPSVGAG